MNTTSDTAGARPISVVFVQYSDATMFCRTVYVTAREETRLLGLLTALCDAGLILRASFAPALSDYGFTEAIDQLRGSVGAHIVDAFIGADRAEPGWEPAPAALMPVWAFECEGATDDILISSARLWDSDLYFEALRVEGDGAPVPVPSVSERFRRWADAVGAERTLSTTRLPGRDGSYVIFAAAAPA